MESVFSELDVGGGGLGCDRMHVIRTLINQNFMLKAFTVVRGGV